MHIVYKNQFIFFLHILFCLSQKKYILFPLLPTKIKNKLEGIILGKGMGSKAKCRNRTKLDVDE